MSLLVGLAYYVTGVLSLRLALVRGQVTPIWPPTGIALAALLLFGRRLWPGIALGAFLVNLPIGPSPLAAAGIAAGNTVAPLLAATLLHKVGFRNQVDRLRDAMAIVFLGALLAMAVSATSGTAILLLSNVVSGRAVWPTWWVWWTGDAMGVLVVAPFLLSLRSPGRHWSWSWRLRGEAVALFAGLAVVAYLVFQTDLHVEYVVFPFLVWAAWRFGQRGAASAALIASGVAIWAAVRGAGPFARATLLEKMVTLQVFNASAAFASFVLAAVIAERMVEIAERKRAEEELALRALHDPLTGLANRMLFMDRLHHALAASERKTRSLAVMFLDLDRFKAINDSLGHEVGDQVIAAIGERLRRAIRPGDTASRFGGDEFVLLCEEVGNGGDALTIAQRVAAAIARPISLDRGEVSVTTSIGIAISQGPHDSPEALVRDADAAVYRAKEHGRDRYELFDNRMRRQAARRLMAEDDLRRGIGEGELRLFYQPLVRLDDRRIAAVEALVRWEHPERGLLAPAEFIPLAEETGLIRPLGAWVLTGACRQLARWRAAGSVGPNLTMAVNISRRQLAGADFEGELRCVLDETGVEGTSLVLEMTETVLIEAGPAILALLRGVRNLGVRLAIDDFGTGYSSLGYLKRFRVDALKIDRSFVRGLGNDPGDSAIVAAVVRIAQAMELSVVAEGVETAEQLAHLRRLRCELAQGEYFAPAQPAEALTRLFILDPELAAS